MRLKKLWRLDAAALLIPIVLFATAIGGSVATGAAPPPPVAAYSFDAGSGSTLADLSGNGNTGAISGATWTTGKTGKALNFDGANDWVTIADSASLDLTTGMTLEAWVRPTQFANRWRTVVFKESSTGTAYSLYSSEWSNRPIGQVNIGRERNVLASPLPLNTWTHLAVTYDGSKLRLYTNAALAGSVDVQGNIPKTGSPLRIGGNAIWDEWFAGQIDDLRIYNRALDANELQTDMKTAVGTPAQTPGDTQPPTAPSNLAVTDRTTSSISIAWTAATDNTGVSKYGLYRDAASVGTTPSTSATFSGLACGTTYALSVEALDAAGNRSAKSSVAASTAACPTSAGNPVAAYSFDAGSGTTLPDASGKGNSGTIANATWGAGKNGGGLVFDGSNDSVTIADSAALDLSTGMTLEAWVKPSDAGSTWRTVIFKETANGTAYSLYSNEHSGVPVGQVNIGGERDAKGATLPLDTWSHLAVTYDGSSLRLYRNGVQASSIAVSGSIPASSGPLRLGGNSIWGEWFAGQMDDARVYARALTAAEIQSDMNTPVGGTSSTPTPPPTPTPSDTQAPTTPGNPTLAGSTDDTISLSWGASTDNVGVTGYGAYRGGSLVGSSSSTTYTFVGLSCGTGYTLAVDAVDAAGNRSGRTASLAASTTVCPPPPPSPPSSSAGTANLWIDANGGSCVRQATKGSYVDGQSCGSMNAAYGQAQPGDLILMKGGSYPGDDILNRTIANTPVVLAPAPGETVTITKGFDIRTHDFILDGGGTPNVQEPDRFLVYGECGSCGGRAIDIEGPRNVVEDVHTRNIYFAGNGDFSTVRFSDIGPSDFGTPGVNFCGDLVLDAGETGAVVEYNLIHDNKMAGCNGAHIDALDLDMDNGVIRGNRIWFCGTQCIFTGDPGSMLIENNMIEETNSCSDCGGPAELALMGTNVVRYNTIEGGDGYGLPDRPGNSTVYANIFLGATYCQTNVANVSVSYSHNIWLSGSGCGSNSKVCVPRLANGNLWTNTDRQADFHLAANDTCAIGAGNPSQYPAQDIDQTTRPQGGSTPDAGADER